MSHHTSDIFKEKTAFSEPRICVVHSRNQIPKIQRKHRLKVNVPAKYQAKPTQITGSFEKTVTTFFALNYYTRINMQSPGNKIRTNDEGKTFKSNAPFSATFNNILE
jgi:hypothetical protein